MECWIDDVAGLLKCDGYFVYVDYTCEEQARPYYVGKGNISRVRLRSRNNLHDAYAKHYGLSRKIVCAIGDEHDAFDEEVRLISFHKTYFYESDFGTNFTRGGEGASGSVRPESAKAKARKPVIQLTLEGEFIKLYPSIKDVQRSIGVGVCSVCQGRLKTAGGYRWMYADGVIPEKRSQLARANMRLAAKKRAIHQVDEDGNIIETFCDANSAFEKTGVKVNNIRRCCYDSHFTAQGYHWIYVDEYHDGIDIKKRDNKRAVQQLTPDGEVIAAFPSMFAAEAATGVFHTNISGCCTGRRKHARGFLWRYAPVSTAT